MIFKSIFQKYPDGVVDRRVASKAGDQGSNSFGLNFFFHYEKIIRHESTDLGMCDWAIGHRHQHFCHQKWAKNNKKISIYKDKDKDHDNFSDELSQWPLILK